VSEDDLTRVLVIDDEPSLLDSWKQVLSRQGIQVQAAGDGETGIRCAETCRPDIVILDLMMPGPDGMHVLQRLKQSRPEVVIIVITGLATLESAIKALRAGAYDFLPKPFTPQELRTIVARAVERRNLARKTAQLEREKERIRENFMAMLSHQMKSPLAGAAEWIEVLAGGLAQPLTEDQQRLLLKIKARIDHLLELVEDFLKLSRLESTGLGEDVEDINLWDMGLEAWSIAKQGASTGGIKFDVKGDFGLRAQYATRGDASLLREAFVNLFSNGIKHTPEDGTITLEFPPPASGVITAKVSDTGAGIPPEEQPFVFNEFFRGKSPREHSVPGTGLGLTIVKRIVEAHDGSVFLESEPGKGTTFTMKFPQRK